MARHFETAGIRPDLVLCSPARRTAETLERLSEALGDPQVMVREWLYSGSVSQIRDHLSRLPEAVDSVLVLGHNPLLQVLALELMAPTGHELEAERALRTKYPTGALAVLDAPDPWAGLVPESCTLRAFVRPRELEGASGPRGEGG